MWQRPKVRNSVVILQQSALDAITRFAGEFLRGGSRQFFRMFVRGNAQKADLFTVTPAPSA